MTVRYKKLIATRFSHNFKEAVEVVEQDLRDPAPNEVIVRNLYAGINTTDTNLTSGRVHYTSPFPLDLGTEAAGEVVVVGSDVQDIKVGDHVVTAMPGAGFREYAIVEENFVVPVPEATPEILGLLVSGTAASIALEVIARLRSSKTVLVTAGASGSGHYAVQLAHMADNTVIATCQNEAQAALLRELGCTRVVNLLDEALDSVLAAEYPDGVDIVYETLGGEIFDTAVEHLAVRGRLIVHGYITEYGGQTQVIPTTRIYSKLLWKSASVHGFRLVDYAQFVLPHVRHLMALLNDGKIRSVIDPTEFAGLEAVPRAVDYLIQGYARGKVIVRLA